MMERMTEKRTSVRMTRRGFLGRLGAGVAAAAAAWGVTWPKKDVNAALFDSLQDKAAIDAVNDWTRRMMREDGFLHKIMPPIPITNDELDRLIPSPPFTWDNLGKRGQHEQASVPRAIGSRSGRSHRRGAAFAQAQAYQEKVRVR
jgi:hypothetical protein